MMEGIALKAAMTMPAILLQKPNSTFQNEGSLGLLGEASDSEGDIAGLLQGRSIQRHLMRSRRNRSSKQQIAHSFAKLMMEGRVRAALRLVTDQDTGGTLSLDKQADPCDSA